ncbi:hypothetical protein [Campylobacter cuniculorum]|uniref:Uncharacterized protein n=2 Tax=Campylobacter cuniculorum TaxID=374106 RepID=A0A1W6BYL0_9BACT|nr:hypothetical protein [Campylobacter cuniculorum]ARJ57120.1 hypothetical protein CCUN_1537 [Campylobacter cuniculorum DSM 23162 = LMG 24588]QOR04565.1 hypothetical protein A0071_01030 [Campylobacter cuniculorum]
MKATYLDYSVKELKDLGVNVNVELKTDIVTTSKDLERFLFENLGEEEEKGVFYKGRYFSIKGDEFRENPLSYEDFKLFFNRESLDNFNLNGLINNELMDKKGRVLSENEFKEDYYSIEECEAFLRKNDYLYFLIGIQSHSNSQISLYESDKTLIKNFGSEGFFGFFYMSKKDFKKTYYNDTSLLLKHMREGMERLEHYLMGNVYSLVIDGVVENTIYGFDIKESLEGVI